MSRRKATHSSIWSVESKSRYIIRTKDVAYPTAQFVGPSFLFHIHLVRVLGGLSLGARLPTQIKRGGGGGGGGGGGSGTVTYIAICSPWNCGGMNLIGCVVALYRWLSVETGIVTQLIIHLATP